MTNDDEPDKPKYLRPNWVSDEAWTVEDWASLVWDGMEPLRKAWMADKAAYARNEVFQYLVGERLLEQAAPQEPRQLVGPPFVIGVTGTRTGGTSMQLAQMRTALWQLVTRVERDLGRPVRAVHGDCVGVDAEFDKACKALGVPVGVHPSTSKTTRAGCASEALSEPGPPMQRNHLIVADADIMLAAPLTSLRPKRGSGTWATIGIARRAGKPLIILYPDGTVEEERMPTSDEWTIAFGKPPA